MSRQPLGAPQMRVRRHPIRDDVCRQERRALLPHQTPLSLAPGEPHAVHLPPPLIRLLPQIDTGQREASYEIACGVGREDDEGGKNEIKALAAVGGSEAGGTRGCFRRSGAVECRAITFPARVFDEAEVARSRRGIIIKGFGYGGMDRADGGGSLTNGERRYDVESVATRVSFSVTRELADTEVGQRNDNCARSSGTIRNTEGGRVNANRK